LESKIMKIAVCLHGYFGTLSTHDFSTAYTGFRHIRQRIAHPSCEVDFYVHCWQPHAKLEIANLYGPKICVVEEQIDFRDVCHYAGIHQTYIDEHFPRSRTMYKNATAERILSFYYSRCESIKFALDNGEYDWVLTTRFDISQRGGPEVNQLKFLVNEENNFFYAANWNQKNAGYGDMWFYGSAEIMERYAKIYDQALSDFKPMSEYEKVLTGGWPDSNFFNIHDVNDKRQFTNEIEKKNKSTNLMKFPKWRITDSHLHHKWFCMRNGLYDVTRWV